MKVLGVHPGPLMYTKIFLRLEPLGLELVAAALCAFSLTPRPVAAGPGRLDHAAARAISAGGVVVSVALVTALAVAPALSGQEQHHHHDGAVSRLALHR